MHRFLPILLLLFLGTVITELQQEPDELKTILQRISATLDRLNDNLNASSSDNVTVGQAISTFLQPLLFMEVVAKGGILWQVLTTGPAHFDVLWWKLSKTFVCGIFILLEILSVLILIREEARNLVMLNVILFACQSISLAFYTWMFVKLQPADPGQNTGLRTGAFPTYGMRNQGDQTNQDL